MNLEFKTNNDNIYNIKVIYTIQDHPFFMEQKKQKLMILFLLKNRMI